jgi:uncharacterized repeat protein (TIGR03803 family)
MKNKTALPTPSGKDGNNRRAWYGVLLATFGLLKSRGRRCLRLPGTVMLALSFLATSANAGVTFTPLFSFNGTNGAVPEATLVQGADGFLYGTTIGGGTNGVSYGGDGTIFRISTNGAFENLVFLNRNSAANPQAGVVQGSDGHFYGTTGFGGPKDSGAVFRVSSVGSFAVLTNFVWPEGEYPNGLVEGADGCFYGSMYWGGTNEGPAGACGTVFKISTNGAITTLVSFNGTNGANPQSGLLRADDGNFYGTTVNGGTNGGWGTVFKITPAGTLTTLVSFTGTNGAAPMSAPRRGVDGCLYGTTSAGGINFDGTPYTGLGTVFKITPAGEMLNLHYFTGYPNDGAQPTFGGLTQGSDGCYYGTTQRGGANASGTIFRISPEGTLSVLYSFSRPDYNTQTNTDGYSPAAGVVQASDGSFYGVTMDGGLFGRGAIFRLTVQADPPVIAVVRQSGGRLGLAWNAVAGREYQLQSNAGFDSTNWVNAGPPISATNSIATAIVTIGSQGQQFYRVVQLP